jgi:hypothetical protein
MKSLGWICVGVSKIGETVFSSILNPAANEKYRTGIITSNQAEMIVFFFMIFFLSLKKFVKYF